VYIYAVFLFFKKIILAAVTVNWLLHSNIKFSLPQIRNGTEKLLRAYVFLLHALYSLYVLVIMSVPQNVCLCTHTFCYS
jgi:hypothetical protein